MQSSFFGFNVALSGLYTAQRDLDVVNHNLSNVSTPGYSRQQAVQKALPAMALYDGTGMVGTGSQVTSVIRVHDEYLDYKYWSENTSLGEWDVKQSQLQEIETIFNEPSNNGSGFNKIMDDFYTSLDDLSKSPSDLSARKVVLNRGVALTNYFNTVATKFEKLQSDVNGSIKLDVDQVNSLAQQISDLNRQIYTLESDGNTANDLRDARGVLVDKLSGIVNIDANEVIVGKLPNGQDDKNFVINISGKSLVDHLEVSKLKVTQRDTKLNTNEDIVNLYDVSWEDGNQIAIRSGELKGYIDIRDGNAGLDEGNGASPDYNGIPYYMRKLNDFVRKFAISFNEGISEITGPDGVTATYAKSDEYTGHANGYGLQKPGAATSPTGIRFFTEEGWSGIEGKTTELTSSEFINGATDINSIADRYKTLTAKNISLSGDMLNQDYGEYNIAASNTAGLAEDNSNLLLFADMRNDTHLFVEGAPEDYMRSLLASLGIESQQSVQFFDNQTNFVKQVDTQRSSVSGVSMNEEMSNMVKFQQAYSAAAKMINTMTQIYDTLINKVDA